MYFDIPMAPLKQPQPSRTESANSVQTIQIRQDVTVTTSTVAEGELNEPRESVSIETTGVGKNNTHKVIDAPQSGLLSRWTSARRGSVSRAQSIQEETPGRRGSASVAPSIYPDNAGRRGSTSVAPSIYQENVERRGSTTAVQSIHHEDSGRLGSISRARSRHRENPGEQTFKDFQTTNDQRDGIRDLAEFLKDVSPPRTNNISVDSDDEPRKLRSVKSSLLSIFSRKKKKKTKKKKQDGLIMLPDSAVAATTTSGARYIAISIPQTAIDSPRSRPNTASRNAKMNLPVLNSVAEVSEGSQRNTIISSPNHSTADRTEERTSPLPERGPNVDEERIFYKEQRRSVSNQNDTPPRRPFSVTKIKPQERPRSARYSIFPPVNDISVPNSEPTSVEARRQSGRPKSCQAGSSTPHISIPPRHSSLFKVPVPRFNVNEEPGSKSLADGEDTGDNAGSRNSTPEFEMVDLPDSPFASTIYHSQRQSMSHSNFCDSQRHSIAYSNFCDSKRQSMAQNLEISQVIDESKRTVSSSTFGTPFGGAFGTNKRISRVIQSDSSRPVSLLPSEIRAARERAFYRLSSMTVTPTGSRQELVRARKARDMMMYNQQTSSRQRTPRIYDLETSSAEEDELVTTLSAGRTAQASRRRMSIPLCEQLVADFCGPNHRGNDQDLYYDAQSSIANPSPMISLSEFPTASASAPASAKTVLKHAPPRDDNTPPTSSSAMSSDSESFLTPHTNRQQLAHSPNSLALVERRQERRIMKRASVDEHRARELEYRLSRLENDNMILRSALLGISESMQGMRDFIISEES